MFVDVLLDQVLADYTNGGTKVATCPQMLAPIALAQVRKLFLNLARRDAFEILHQFGGAEKWRTRHQQMDMIRPNMPLHYRHFAAHTDLSDDVARSFGHFRSQHFVAIFCHPHLVVLDVVDSMRSFSVFRHITFSYYSLEGNPTLPC